MLKFGTSGIRGLVSDFTDSEVRLFITAFLMHAKNKGQTSPVAFAQDLRESSPRIQDAAVKAVQEFSREAILCGPLPTPALALFTQKHRCLGVMITGSHIPADRNGIKFYLETGETLKADDQAIMSIYEKLKAEPSDSFKSPPVVNEIKDCRSEARSLYINRYQNFFPKNPLRGYKVVFYQHSSVARDLFPEILETLGAEVTCVGRSETFIPVDTEAIEAIDQFKDWIVEHKADALISTDGDADRPLFVDERGSVISGDKLGALASIYLDCEAIALPISCNSGIGKIDSFKRVAWTKIGSPFVIESLNNLSQEFSAVAGFEANGGYILQSDFQNDGRTLEKLPTRDAVLPVVAALTLAKQRSLKISELTHLLPPVFTASGLLKNFAVEKSVALLQRIESNPEAFFQTALKDPSLSLVRVNKLDGLRCEFAGDITIHIRPSGNAPELRCYTEAASQNLADHLGQEVLRYIAGQG